MNKRTRQVIMMCGDGVKDSRAAGGGKRFAGRDRDAARRERRKG